MTSSPPEPFDVVVVGAGPAGVVAALRAARLGAKTALITRDQFGGMAANDGPVPVRTLAQAARLIREARQLPRYGIAGGEPSLDFPRLLERVREVTAAAREQTLLRDDLERAGVRLYERAGPARFADAHTVESDNALRLHADKVILCTGGTSRPLPVPGFELTATHSDAWNLSSVPPSMLVIGRELHTILGCHVVGERAVELAQLAATAMAAQMPVEQLALVPFSFPTYANGLGRAAILAAIDLDRTGMWAVDHLETAVEVGVA